MSVLPERLAASHVRLYETLRTAHLERAHAGAPVATIYRTRRYDFDDASASGLEIVQTGRLGAALLIARSRPFVLEINEPLMLSSIRTSAVALLALMLTAPRGVRPRVVTYAIGNDDPFVAPAKKLRARLRRRVDRALARFVWSRLDRIVFGTAGAEETYRAALGRPLCASRLIEALPAPLPGAERTRDEDSVMFLGAFVERKGLPLLLEAWPIVVARHPEARLRLFGKGVGEAAVRRFATDHPNVVIRVDPSRSEIFDALMSSRVVVLASQRTSGWREQVGLPIVEGLSAGCAIVATDETGLAPWLSAEGHSVVVAGTGPDELAHAIMHAMASGPSPADVVASLPSTDGRLLADLWLHDDTPAPKKNAAAR